jgi:hypothetical protein
MKVSEVRSAGAGREQRVAVHSHIRGLGLREPTGEAEPVAAGFVGQTDAREVCPLSPPLSFPGAPRADSARARPCARTHRRRAWWLT